VAHTSRDLLDALGADLEAGYGTFVRAHADAVYSTALRLSGSRPDAEDLAQETFVRAYRALRRYDADRIRSLEARPWLLTITLNLWRNGVRAAQRRPPPSPHPVTDRAAHDAPGPEDLAVSADEGRALAALVRRLPEHHRAPVVLRHVAGLSYAEVAGVLGCPEGTAKANVARGLARLRTLATSDAGSPPPPAPRRPGRGRPRARAASSAATRSLRPAPPPPSRPAPRARGTTPLKEVR